eukprot:3963226-Pleurochrysis_carterae.AAC.2
MLIAMRRGGAGAPFPHCRSFIIRDLGLRRRFRCCPLSRDAAAAQALGALLDLDMEAVAK